MATCVLLFYESWKRVGGVGGAKLPCWCECLIDTGEQELIIMLICTILPSNTKDYWNWIIVCIIHEGVNASVLEQRDDIIVIDLQIYTYEKIHCDFFL